jgi:capsular exopolysaccharide synthesis family protein
MSIQDDTSLEHSSNGQSLVVHQTAPLGPKDLDWGTVPAYASGAGAIEPGDPSRYLHAVRRHWLLSLVLGVLLSGMLGISTWLLIPQKYTATSLIDIAMNEDNLILPGNRVLQQEYETFKNTQPQYVTSRLVLQAALRPAEINNLSIVQREKADQITWLGDELKISFPGDAQVMTVSLSDTDPEEAAKVVRAVVNAYMREIVDRDHEERSKKLASLKKALAIKDSEIRKQQRLLEQRVDEIGTIDKESIRLQSSNLMQQLGMQRNQLRAIDNDLRTYRSEFRAAEGALDRLNQTQAVGIELETMRQRDAISREFEKQIATLRQVVGQESQALRPGAKAPPGSGRFTEQLALVQEQLNARTAELKAIILESKRAELDDIAKDRSLLIKLAEADRKDYANDIMRLQEQIATFGHSSVEVEMAQMTIDDLKQVRAEVANKYEALKVELESRPRIRVVQDAEEPKSVDNLEIKAVASVLAGLLGFILPAVIVVQWDVHKNRVNSSEDVAKGLGLSVIGSVPMIPSRAINRLDAPTKRNQQWNMRLAESIDSIAAKLLRNAALDKNRVVLITSAVSGEGKTTLATQIAMSLARAGRRTVLVDFDLRRPAIDKAFQLPLHPGVSETLCGENEAADLLQPTGFANLDVITAGRCDRHALQALANGGDRQLFDKLRDTHEFVIVDGSPILPVADSRYVSQHVDSVVLSVFRDYSRIPKVTAAREILEAFGANAIEAVVTSSAEDGYGVIDTVSAEPKSTM